MNNQKRWSGFRELESQEIDKLVDAITDEVRKRGPFLSMAEFVNRRLASASDEMSARGALRKPSASPVSMRSRWGRSTA